MALTEMFFYSRSRLKGGSIANTIGSKSPAKARPVWVYTRRLTPQELKEHFPLLETHIHEHTLLVDPIKGTSVTSTFPMYSFHSHDLDKTVMDSKIIFFSSEHKKLHYDNLKRKRKERQL